MSTKIKIEWDDELKKALAPLYVRYDRQTKAQPAHIELQQDGTLSAGVCGEIGNAVPEDVWHGRRLWWGIAAEMTGAAVAELLQEIAPLAQRVLDGWDEKWDGNNNVGTLTDDAQEAHDEIEAVCNETGKSEDRASVWDAAEWLDSYDWPDYHWTADANWESVAAQLVDEAHGDGVLLEGDVADVLKKKAMDALENSKHEELPLPVLKLIADEEFEGGITEATTDEELDEYSYAWIDSARNLRDGLRKHQEAEKK